MDEKMRSELVDGLCNILKDDIRQIILYGSVARKEDTSESDIDIAVVIEGVLTAENRKRLLSLAADLDLRYERVFSIIDIEQENLEKWGWAVDFIITHCCPTSVQETLGVESCRPDALTDFLEEAARNCRFRHWFFGHYHGDRRVGEKFTLLYQKIAELKEGGAQISLPGG